MWNESESQAKVFQDDAIAAFKKDNPNVDLKVQWCGRTVPTMAKAALASGQQIDVLEKAGTYPDAMSVSLKLDDYYNKTYSTTSGKTFKDTLMPIALDFVKLKSNNQGYYFIPEQISTAGWFYNKELFKQAGVASAPKTWDEFLDVCAKLKAKGITPITMDDAYYNLPMGQYLNQLIGQDAIKTMVTDKTGAKWDDSAVTQAAKAVADLVAKGYISKNASTNKYPAGQQELAVGKAAMYLNGSWLPNEVSATAGSDFQWGCFSFPTVPNAKIANTVGTITAQTITVTNTSKNPDAAFEFATYLVEGQTAKDLVTKCQCIPVVKGLDYPKSLSDCKAMISKFTGITDFANQWGANSAITATQTTDFGKLLAGQMTADQYDSDLKAKLKG